MWRRVGCAAVGGLSRRGPGRGQRDGNGAAAGRSLVGDGAGALLREGRPEWGGTDSAGWCRCAKGGEAAGFYGREKGLLGR
jgi:hypothetical protein